MLQLLTLALAATTAFASPAPERRDSTATTLTTEQIAPWKNLAYYAAAAYCSSSKIKSWSCGTACSSLSTPTTVYATGGDNAQTPYWYVLNNGSAIIVSICGTNVLSSASIAVDLDYTLTAPDSTYFPNNNGAKLHHGFYSAFTRLASGVAAGVQSGLNDGITDVIVIGHSLGGAIGHQTATYLQQKFTNATVYGRLFASPRVGNPAWANYVDSTLGTRAQHIVNYNDAVPQEPSQSAGFQQSSNEIWISNAAGTKYIACSGQENKSCQDSLAAATGTSVHLGPYAGVYISSCY